MQRDSSYGHTLDPDQWDVFVGAGHVRYRQEDSGGLHGQGGCAEEGRRRDCQARQAHGLRRPAQLAPPSQGHRQ